MKYRKKPVIIEAICFQDNLPEIYKFAGDNVIYMAGRLKITTMEEDIFAEYGDWIIKGIKGEFYPCKPNIFKKTYEVAQ